MKVAIYQCKSIQNKTKNISRAKSAIFKAATNNCDLIVFLELFLTGYFSEKKYNMLAITMNDKGIKLIRSFCNQKRIACIFGFPRKENEKIYNSACIIDKNGEIIGIYDKTHLWDKEKLIFQKGNKLSVFNTSIGKIGILICYDIDFPEPSRILTLKNADIICCISANMKPYDNIHKTFIKTRSLENNIPIVYCNYVGNDEYFEYVGQSNIIDRMGKPQQKFSRQDKLLYGDIDLNYKCENSYIKDLRTDLYYSEYYNDKLNK